MQSHVMLGLNCHEILYCWFLAYEFAKIKKEWICEKMLLCPITVGHWPKYEHDSYGHLFDHLLVHHALLPSIIQ